MGSLARLSILLLLVSVFLTLMSDSVASRDENENPLLFRSKNFKIRYENERGRIRILPNPYREIDNNFQWLPRYAEYELKPQSLFLPHHRDAVSLLVVHEGRALATIVNQTHRETYQLEHGDILKTPPGNLVYTANVEENQRFRASSVLFPINIPGRYENFYPSGNQNPRSYYQAFSEKTLEATFNSNYKEIQKVLFGEQQEGEKGQVQERSNEGVMVSLSGEQAREIRRQAELSSSERRSSSSLLINLRNLEPRYANNHGRLWEACPENFDILRDLDMSVVLLELKKGSVFLPHYNSKAISAAQIIEGKAKLELASTYIPKERWEEDDNKHEKESEEQDRSEGQIQGMSAKLNEGDLFVAPAGHPLAIRASKKNDLWMVAFLINAKNNQRNFLGGERDNVINQIDRIVMEKTFGGSADEIQKLLRNQKKSYFADAQEQRTPLSSILEEDFF